MQNVNTDELDLRTLRLMRTMLETTSVSRTAAEWGLSQPTVSRTLARLRTMFRDPLLVRTRAGYVTTPRAESLKPLVDASLRATEALLASPDFDPRTSTRRFRIATTDYGAVTVVAPAVGRFTSGAPRASMDVVPFGSNTLADLESGALDLALWADATLPPDFHFRRLFRETYSCLVRPDHPLTRASAKTILATLRDFSQLRLLFPNGGLLTEDDALETLTVGPTHVAIRTAYFTSAAAMLAHTSLVLCAPSRMALHAAKVHGLVALPLPTKHLSFDYRSIWHERAHRDAANKWLRGLF